jgi:hypothetical protein
MCQINNVRTRADDKLNGSTGVNTNRNKHKTNLYNLREQMILNTAAPNDFTTQEVDTDTEIIKAQIGIIKNKQTERLMFRSRVKWYEEGEKNNAYCLGLMNSKYSRLELDKVTDYEGTAFDKNTISHKVKMFYLM